MPDLSMGLHDGHQERTVFINYDAAPELHVPTSPFHTGELSHGRYGHFHAPLYIPLLLVLHTKQTWGRENDLNDHG
jgi:hypothetical protein